MPAHRASCMIVSAVADMSGLPIPESNRPSDTIPIALVGLAQINPDLVDAVDGVARTRANVIPASIARLVTAHPLPQAAL
jgi:hypothetical protein